MIVNGVATILMLLALQQAPAASPVAGQSATAPQAAGTTAAAPASGIQSTSSCEGGQCDLQPPHITIATPAPAPAPWSLPDRIQWATEVLLAVLGYAGIFVALFTLRKIERQTRHVEAAATAAEQTAQAALLYAQAIVQADRPWILVAVEPKRTIENGFTVVAVNRGRSPARILSTIDRTIIVPDEAHLPAQPDYGASAPDSPSASVIVLPGESTVIKSFSRSDVQELCGTHEQMRKVETWEQKIYFFGIIRYENLIPHAGEQVYESTWCCWYIHGQKKSGLAMAGTPAYNRHS